MKRGSLSLLALSLPLAVSAGEGVFDLGTVVVTAARPQVGEVASAQVSSVVSREEIRQFDRTTVSEAVNLLSGVKWLHYSLTFIEFAEVSSSARSFGSRC